MTCRCGYANTPPDPDQNRDEGDARSSSTARAAFWYILLLSVPFCLVAFPIFLVSVSTLQNKKQPGTDTRQKIKRGHVSDPDQKHNTGGQIPFRFSRTHNK